MILSKKPLSIAELKEYMKEQEGNEELIRYLKRFGKLNIENTRKLKEEIVGLGNVKIKDEYVVKIIDFLPRDMEDLNKIMSDANLSEEEGNAILKVVEKY